MIVVDTFDFIFSAYAELNSEDSDRIGTFCGAFMLGALTMPTLFSTLPNLATGKALAIFIFAPLMLLVGGLYGALRSNRISKLRASLSLETLWPLRLKIVSLTLLLLFPQFPATTSSPVASLAVLLSLAALPWQRWICPQCAP